MTLRLGLIGRGRWGQKIERTLLSIPDVTLCIVGKGERPNEGLDGVLIATQSATHAQVALPYIEAGIATFIEKPLTTTVADAERIRTAAGRSGAVVFVGHIFLHHPAFTATLALLPALGAIRCILCEGMNDSPRLDSSVLWDWLPHDLSMAHAIFDREPDRVAAWALVGEKTHPHAALSVFRYGNTPITSTVSWLSPIARKQMTIVCDGGMLVFDDKAERRLVLYDTQGQLSYPSYGDDLPLTCEIQAFLRAVRSGQADPAEITRSSSIVRAIAAAERSILMDGQPMMIARENQ